MTLRLVKAARVQPEGADSPENPGADPRPAGALFAAYAPYVAAIATRLLGRADEIEDVVQEVFVVVITGLHQVREADAIKGWLATITVRVAMRKLLWRRLRGWLRLGDRRSYQDGYEDLPDPALSGEERAAVACIYRLLDGLPAGQRTAWLLHHGEGLRAEEIAGMCGCSLATAKRWIAFVNDEIRRSIVDG